MTNTSPLLIARVTREQQNIKHFERTEYVRISNVFFCICVIVFDSLLASQVVQVCQEAQSLNTNPQNWIDLGSLSFWVNASVMSLVQEQEKKSVFQSCVSH